MSKQSQPSMLANRPFSARQKAFDRQGIEHGSSIERQVTNSFESLTLYPQGSVVLSTGVFGADCDLSYPTEPASGSWVAWVPFSSKFEFGRNTRPQASSGFGAGISFGSRERPSLSLSVQDVVFESAGLLSGKLSSRLQELSTLKDGWDGESAKAVRLEAMLSTVTLLSGLRRSAGFRLPFVAPTHDGYLLMEWANSGRRLEVELGPNGVALVGTLIRAGGDNEYFNASADADWENVQPYYSWFCGESPIWPRE